MSKSKTINARVTLTVIVNLKIVEVEGFTKEDYKRMAGGMAFITIPEKISDECEVSLVQIDNTEGVVYGGVDQFSYTFTRDLGTLREI